MDSTAQRAHVGYKIINKNRVAVESEIINELLPRVMYGFDSAKSPCGL
jgi:hypothetical protein